MNETTDQMSLLDAIGFPAPEETKKAKKLTAKPATRPAKEAKRKQAPKKQAEADPAPEEVAVSTRLTDEAGADSAPSAEPSNDAAKLPESLAAGPSASIAEGDQVTLDRYICFALYSANHAMNGVYKALLKDVGLTYPQFLAMTVLWETNNVPVGTLTSKLQLDTNTLTPLLKRLEAMDLLTRTRNKKDERQVILKLTRKGRALQKKTEHFSNCILPATGLDLDEVMELQSRIMKLRDSLRAAEL